MAMRSGTAGEFQATNYWKYQEKRLVSKRNQDIYYSDCGTEVASKHIWYSRGSVQNISYSVNPDYISKEFKALEEYFYSDTGEPK